MKSCVYLFLFTFIYFVYSSYLPLRLDLVNENKGNLEFQLHLPNNDTIQVDLSFQLLSNNNSSNATNEDDKNNNDTNNDEANDNETNNDEIDMEVVLFNFTTTTTTAQPDTKYVTVQEAIEAFRQELLKKERDIAGIIESEHPFYRHFRLEFDENISLTVRCTYDSNYQKRSLNISCYEYHEYVTERILSNGEVEVIQTQDPNYKSNVELINAKSMKQTYSMEIS